MNLPGGESSNASASGESEGNEAGETPAPPESDGSESGESSSAYAGTESSGGETEGNETGETEGNETGETPVPPEQEAAWTAFYEWSASQCWGPKCEDSGAAQFARLTAKLKELGLPVEDPF